MTDPGELPVRFDEGVVPVVVQDAGSGEVLMLAFMNAEALRLTRETGYVHYWSRSRKRLWKKGETSGHVQVVDEIRVNCERNSLLLRVRQVGAVCHDGYETCFYRRVESDGTLTVVRERSFDPADVYRADSVVHPEPDGASNRLTDATLLQFGAYEFLRDTPLEEVSGTSQRLRAAESALDTRVAGELRELAGVIDGTHRHVDPASDLRLEASQVLYWVLLSCLRGGLTWPQLRPDQALSSPAIESNLPLLQRLHVAADRWERDRTVDDDRTPLARHTLALIGEACRCGGVDPLAVIERDLRDLAARPYLEPYFALAQRWATVTDQNRES